jgi:cyanate lyase
VALRKSGMSLTHIGRRFGLTRQRVAQIIDKAGRVPVDAVRQVRRDEQLERALARADELVGCYRAGLTVGQIAQQTGLSYRAIRAAIGGQASAADRAQRKASAAVAIPSPRYSDRQLIAGLRRVAGRLGHAPSSGEYARLAAELELPRMPTVYQRFGGWRAALDRAGLQVPAAPARAYTPTWHIAACWKALLGVADQLGEPPRYRRYLELARQRDDLPSAATVRARLGLWSAIAAELTAHAQRRAANAGPQPTGDRPAAGDVEPLKVVA